LDWDYRIIKDQEGFMKIHKVFYRPDGAVYGMSEDDICIEGEDASELITEFNILKKAFDKPIIEFGRRAGDTQLIKREPSPTLPDIPDDFMDNFSSITSE
jgi:hypothetical protein